MVRAARAHQPLVRRENLGWIIAAQAVSILPLLLTLPIWVGGVWLFALTWRVQIYRNRWLYPPIWVKFALGGVCVAGIIFSFSGVNGVEPMIGFLVCSFALKLIEMRTQKDVLIVLFIAFIALASQFLFAQDMLAAIVGLFVLLVLLAAWQSTFSLRLQSVPYRLRQSGVLVLKSMPLMVVLFLIMPRIGPLWTVPVPEGGRGQTGFSDSMTLGDIGNLVRSPETAFRVTFDGPSPSVDQMYWQGLILDQFDGRTWTAAEQASRFSRFGTSDNRLKPAGEQPFVQYSVILEPHFEHWLFSLGAPVSVQSTQLNVLITPQRLLATAQPVSQKSAYSVQSILNEADSTVALDRDRLLHMPDQSNPRARALGESWQAEGMNTQAKVDTALTLFRRDFSYTLQPSTLGQHALDEFLFETQRGFCEHFASSFVFLMRAAGVPARVVVGYQGGEARSQGSYYTVRQSDAHAWAEVWYDQLGWQRVDPTAAVAPSRVEFGVEGALAMDERGLVNQGLWQGAWVRPIYQRWDALSHSWNRWVLSYDSGLQQGFLRWLLGDASPWRVGVVFIVVCAIILGALVIIPYLLRRQVKRSPENRAVQQLLRRLSRLGIERRPGETLAIFAQRVGREQPNYRIALQKIAESYESVAYREQTHDLVELQRHVRFFPRLPPKG